MSPLAVLNRGYALVYDPEEKILTRAAEADRQKEMTLQFADGRVHVVVLTLDGDGISKLNLIEKNAGGAIEAAATVE